MAIKHFLQFKDFTREEFAYVFERSRWIKNQFKSYEKYWPLVGSFMKELSVKVAASVATEMIKGLW